jgi:phage terminase small subunit
MRGRRPKPTSLHHLQGTYNPTDHGRAREGEPVAEGELGREPPAWFTPSQKAGWRYAIDHMPKGVAKAIDRGMLTIWVEAEDRHVIAMQDQARLDAQPGKLRLLIPTPAGLVPSPYNAILADTAKTMFRAAQELGFSPAARPRIHATPAPAAGDADNPWAALRLVHGGKNA